MVWKDHNNFLTESDDKSKFKQFPLPFPILIISRPIMFFKDLDLNWKWIAVLSPYLFKWLIEVSDRLFGWSCVPRVADLVGCGGSLTSELGRWDYLRLIRVFRGQFMGFEWMKILWLSSKRCEFVTDIYVIMCRQYLLIS